MTNSQSQSQWVSNNIDYFSLLRHQNVGAVLSNFYLGMYFGRGGGATALPAPFYLAAYVT